MTDSERSRKHLLRALILGAALVVGLGMYCAAGSVASAASRARVVPGRGVWLAGHTDFVGYYRALVGGRWVKVYCVSPGRRAPTRISLRTVSRVPAKSAAITRQLAETLTAHGDARTAAQAEAVSQALNAEIGNRTAVALRARHLSRHVRELAERYVAEARARGGPYSLELHLPANPLPGQSGTGTVTLRAAGNRVAGAVISLRHTANVAMPRSVRTNASGRAAFTYRTIGGGPVHVAAAAGGAPDTVRASRPGRSTQLMLTWSPRKTVHAVATYQGKGPGFAHRYACSRDCDGHPLVTLTACAPASRVPSRLTYWFDGRSHRITFDAAKARTCKTWQVVVADGVSVSATWEWRTAHGWTQPIPAEGWFVVDCPAAPPVAVALGYDCTRATLTAVLGTQSNGSLVPLRNDTAHRMVLVVGGAVDGRYELAPGATAAPHTFALRCGSHATITVRGGVQRGASTYNYGRITEVTTP
jgi:hypothetical protein